MKRILKVVALCTMLIMLLQPVMALAAVEEPDDGLLTWEEIEEIRQLEYPSITAHQELFDAWTDQTGNVAYPDWYGGCFIDSDHKLTIAIVDDFEQHVSEIEHIIANNGCLRFINADISYNDLQSIYQALVNEPDAQYANSVYISERNNTVELDVSPSYADHVATGLANAGIGTNCVHVNEVSENPAQETSPNSQYNLSATTVLPGHTMYNNSSRGTIGWYGTYTFSNGTRANCILTAGHVVQGLQGGGDVKVDGDISTIVISGSNLSSSAYTHYVCLNFSLSHVSTRGDYGFIRTSLSPSNEIYIGNTESPRTVTEYLTSVNDLIEGQTIVFKGYGLSGFSSATVKAVNTTWIYDSFMDQQMTGMVSVTNSSVNFGIPGDSGAPVYTFGPTSNTFKLCGIFTGGTTYQSPADNTFYFTPMPIIVGAGFQPYLG